MKYNEKSHLEEAADFISAAYDSTKTRPMSFLSIPESIGGLKTWCHVNALRCLYQYGKANERDKRELFNAIHCIAILLDLDESAAHVKPERSEAREYDFRVIDVFDEADAERQLDEILDASQGSEYASIFNSVLDKQCRE